MRTRAGVEEVAGVNATTATFLEANWLETTLFLNRGDHFDAKPLPMEAQLAPAFAVSVADVDGDGHDDAFLSQNFFEAGQETSRYDAGRGLLLLGDGKGSLTPVAAHHSGILLHGEQRGAAFCDFDRDGRVDLAVAQNSGPTGLFRNVKGKPGLRVRLQGPPWNRDGAGAIIRLKYKELMGPARCVQVGSGYWSQESIIQVMSSPAPPSAVWIRWPGGRITQKVVRSGEQEILVTCE
jgi:enediyne biosynthesis protein E4